MTDLLPRLETDMELDEVGSRGLGFDERQMFRNGHGDVKTVTAVSVVVGRVEEVVQLART